MTNPKNGSTLAPWQLISIGAGSVVILGLAGFGVWNLLAPRSNTSQSTTDSQPQSSVQQKQNSPSSQPQDAATQKLIGQWQMEKASDSSGTKVFLVFTANNKFYFLQNNQANEGSYQFIDNNYSPQKIKITFQLGKGKVFSSDFNLVSEKQLICLDITFCFNSTFQKTSDQGVLPEGTRIFTEKDLQAGLERQDLLRIQSEGRNNAGAFNRAQQAYYLEKSQFASSFAALGVGISEEGRTYRYTINIVDRGQMVLLIATPKQEGMKSYMGIVKTVSIGGQVATTAIACESLQPTTAIPPKPSNSGRNTGEPTCPDGYRDLSN